VHNQATFSGVGRTWEGEALPEKLPMPKYLP
jgi:hypothetical protein